MFCSKDNSILIFLIKKEIKLAVLLRCWKKHVTRNTFYRNLLLSKFEGLQPEVMLFIGPALPREKVKNTFIST